MRSRASQSAVLVLAAALAAAGCSAEAEGRPEQAPDAPAVAAPDVSVIDFPGLQREIESRKGQPVLVNFWAIWCQPCVAELPDLIAASRALRDAGGEVLGVSLDFTAPGRTLQEIVAQMPEFARKHGMDYPIPVYSGDFTLLQDAYGLEGLPYTFVVDASGEIVGRHAGRATREELDALVAAVLGR